MGKGNFRNFLKKTQQYDSDDTTRTSPVFRIIVLLLICVFAMACLINFVRLQIVKGDEYKKKAYDQQNSWREISAKRGDILDTNGVQLATSIVTNIIYVDPNQIRDAFEKKLIKLSQDAYYEKVATYLSEKFELEYDAVYQRLTADSSYQIIARQVDRSIGTEVSTWISNNGIRGVHVDNDYKRIYTNGTLLSQVIGFVNINEGLLGIEASMNDELSGVNGRVVSATDRLGNPLPYEEISLIEAKDGYNTVLTIDGNIQQIALTALEEAVEKNGCINGGCIIVMDADNADVLAMASYPYFDSNDPYAMPSSYTGEIWNGHTNEDVSYLYKTVWRNKAISDTYEPGSTFKTITAAIALEESIVEAETMVNDSALNLADWTISCWSKWNDHGDETFAEALKNSCNAAFAKVALEIGIEKFYNYVSAFGYYTKTGVNLSGEATGIFHTNPTEIDLAVASFGQRFQITPLQQATAYCAIANGGTLYEPRIVRALTDSNGTLVKTYENVAVRNVISSATSEELLSMLEAVVAEGTGSNAYVSGYRVAGKTGTSETTETDTIGRYIASFAGIAPADNPEIVVLVVLDYPTVGSASGGRQAAPVAGDVIEQVLEYLGVERRYTDLDKSNLMVKAYVPNVVGKTVTEARLLLANSKFKCIIPDLPEGANEDEFFITEQIPGGNAYITYESTIYLYCTEGSSKQTTSVPNLHGYSLDDAYGILNRLGLTMSANCIGYVTGQDIAPGTVVPKGTVISIELENTNTETMG